MSSRSRNLTDWLHSTQGTGVSPERIAVGEAVDHRLAEAVLVVEHVMRNADALGDAARIVDVLAGAAGALAVGRRAVVVKLQRDADDVVALGLQQRRRDRGIDAARHGDDDAGVLRPPFEIETVEHVMAASDAGRAPHREFCSPLNTQSVRKA